MSSNLYWCTNADCQTKRTSRKSAEKGQGDQQFIPLRHLMCGHSVCDLCILNVCKEEKEFIKCTVCSFNTTITDSVQRNVTQYETDIKRWLDPNSVTAPEVLRFDANLFPLDFFQIGCGVHLGQLTATKTAETIDLDLDDDAAPTPAVQTVVNTSVTNSLFEDDSIVRIIASRIPRTAPEKFRESVENGIKTFTDLSQNHTSIKRCSDETKEWFKMMKTNAREVFHNMHSILQKREKDLMEEMSNTEEKRLQELRVYMNEILSKRSELKGKLLQSPQLQTDKDRNALKKSIDRLVKDANITSIESPKNEFNFVFETSIERQLKKFGKVIQQKTDVTPEDEQQMETTPEEINKTIDTTVDVDVVSSDEEAEDLDIEEVSKDGQKIDREVVSILKIESPSKFYVQKSSDKERFEILNEEIKLICGSPFNHSPAFETIHPGDQIFAYSSKKGIWCRATITHFRTQYNQNSRENDHLADCVLIDYGVSETVMWYNIRERKVELFDDRKWPPFAYKCSLYGLKPHRKSGQNWAREATDLFAKYVINNQLVLIEFETKDCVKYVDLIHYDVPDVTYQIPSVIEVLNRSEMATLTENIDFNSYCRFKGQSLKYPVPEVPQTLKTISVLVSHVESPDLFYVQLQRTHSDLMTLVEELNRIYTKENEGIYTYYCPKVNTPCVALFDGDGKYYRALVIQKGKTATEFVVHFVDFGNKQSVKNSNIRLIKDSYMEFPIQAIPCRLIHVDPSYGFKWSDKATQAFKYAISNERGPQILTMCVYETLPFNEISGKLSVVLRSYDGVDNGIKINEHLVKQKLAFSTGMHSKPDDQIDPRILSASQESLNSMSSERSVESNTTNRSLPIVALPSISAFLALKELMERFESSLADKRSSLIKVKVFEVKTPKEFYLQIDRTEIRNYFEKQEKKLHEICSAMKFSGDIQFEEKQLCAFKVNTEWRRGRIIKRVDQMSSTAPEEPRYLICDMDYGSEQEIKVSLMRKLSEEFEKDGPFAIMCQLYALRPTGGDQWSLSAKDMLKDFVKEFKNDLYILVKGSVDSEPISVSLFSRQEIIPGAFSQKKIIYESINNRFIENGLATWDKTIAAIFQTDDEDINTVTPRDLKTQMPFSLMSSNDSVLGSLQRLNNDTNPPKIGEFFKYLKEVYPKEQTFFGQGTDLSISHEYHISFRYIWEGISQQPNQMIENQISQTLNEKGELAPFTGPYTTGAACTAYFDFDKTWNRAEIEGITRMPDSQQNQMIVRFVDYGNQQNTLVDRLSSEVFGRETPKQALKCQLINIKAKSQEADTLIRNAIYTKVLDHKCRYFWENYPNLPMKATVEIEDPKNKKAFKPLIQYLEEENLLAEKIDDNDTIEDILNINSMIEETYGLFPIVFRPERFYRVMLSHSVGNTFVYLQSLQVLSPIGKESIINVEHNSFLDMLERMRSRVDLFPLIKSFREGFQCVAKYDDNCWYRGIILSADGNANTAQIYFVDHGNIDPVSFDHIKVLPKNYMNPKAHAFLAKIYNIKLPKDQMWSRCPQLVGQMMSRLADLSANGQLLARIKNSSYPLKVDLYEVDDNDPTVPGKHVFQDFVNKGLLEFEDVRDVWRKPIETTQSYLSSKTVTIKPEPID